MKHWYMLTLVGEDRPGIVAKVTSALFDGDCNLGDPGELCKSPPDTGHGVAHEG